MHETLIIFGEIQFCNKALTSLKYFKDALQWLISAGLVYKVAKIEKPGVPLSAYADDSYFKLYLCDVGLLRAMADIPLSSIKYADDHVRSRSLAVYMDKYKPDFAIRLSAKNAGVEPPLYSEPLYLTYRLADWFGAQ